MMHCTDHLSLVLDLCKAMGHCLCHLHFVFDNSKRYIDFAILGQIKEACPEVAIHLESSSTDILQTMRELRDSLVEVKVRYFVNTPNSLADCAAMRTMLRRVTIELSDRCAEEFLYVLLACLGGTFHDLNLCIYNGPRRRTLEVESPSYFNSIAKHCANLRRFQLETELLHTSFTEIAMASPGLRSFAFCVYCRIIARQIKSLGIGLPEQLRTSLEIVLYWKILSLMNVIQVKKVEKHIADE